MNMKMLRTGFFILAAGALLSTGFAAMMVYNFQLPESALEFKVDSTLHKIEGKVTAFSIKPLSFDFDKPELRENIEVTFPVLAMDTGMKARDAAMYKTFDSAHYSRVSYKAATVRCSPETADRLSCVVPGELTIRNKTLSVPLHAVIERRGSALHARGEAKLSLAAFDLHPPSVLGLIKVFDEVTINFDTGWNPASPAAPPAKEASKPL